MIPCALPATLDGDELRPGTWSVELVINDKRIPQFNCLLRLDNGHVCCVELAGVEIVNGVWILTAAGSWRHRVQQAHAKRSGG